MKELQQDAKELGINFVGKTKEILTKEIQEKKGPTTLGTEPVIEVRRTNSDLVKERTEEIRRDWKAKNYDPTADVYKLSIKNREAGWHYRFVSDKQGRIENMQARGYQAVETIDSVSAGDNSGGERLIPMKIPQAIFDEIQASKQARIKKDEEAILKADFGKKGLDSKNVAPESFIKMTQKEVRLGAN